MTKITPDATDSGLSQSTGLNAAITHQWGHVHTLPYGVGENTRVYAIGDIHGCDTLLKSLLQQIGDDFALAQATQPDLDGVLIYLGDLVDRGPDSRAVMDVVVQGPPPGLSQVLIKGNHEYLMEAFLLGDQERASVWLVNGGLQTLQSYGLSTGDGVPADDEIVDLQRGFAKRVPRQHESLLSAAVLSHQVGDVFFAHAGIDPETSLDAQVAEDLLWIREPFLSSEKDFGAYVVHGHTPHNGMEVFDNRSNADTGAVYGGWLSAAVITGHRLQYLQVSDGISHFVRRVLPV